MVCFNRSLHVENQKSKDYCKADQNTDVYGIFFFNNISAGHTTAYKSSLLQVTDVTSYMIGITML